MMKISIAHSVTLHVFARFVDTERIIEECDKRTADGSSQSVLSVVQVWLAEKFGLQNKKIRGDWLVFLVDTTKFQQAEKSELFWFTNKNTLSTE